MTADGDGVQVQTSQVAASSTAVPMVEQNGIQASSENGTEKGPDIIENGIISAQQGLNRKQRQLEKKKNRLKKKREQKRTEEQQKQIVAKTSRKTQQRKDRKKKEEDTDSEQFDNIDFEYISAPIEHELEGLKDIQLSEGEEEGEEEDNVNGGLGGLGSRPTANSILNSFRNNQNKENHSMESAIQELKEVFSKFHTAEQLTGLVQDEDEENDEGVKAVPVPSLDAQVKVQDDDEEESEEEEDDESKMSKKKRKQQNRLKIAQLKQLCERPEVVEVWDVTANDPKTLVYIKAYRNSVPVPRHWSQKRKYLQGKRGIEKPGFKLPSFLEATGISEMRAAYHEKEQQKMMKQRQRERVRPKMGRLDIDYQILYDAFFKHQTKPNLTLMGEMYYEGKEFEVSHRHTRPGNLSEDLKKALGMTDTAPPPWLINMQRYGPPPSYPNLKISGLNAPIPKGASFGYHPGGWGKPPVDQDGNPLYGDVFGQYQGQQLNETVPLEQKQYNWGGLESEEEEEDESSEEEESEEEEEEEAVNEQANKTAAQAQNQTQLSEDQIAEGIASGMRSGFQSGIASSLPSGLDTPSEVNLRKGVQSGTDSERLYTVLKEKKSAVGAAIMGSDHVYELPNKDLDASKARGDKVVTKQSLVEVALNPEQLEGLDQNTIRELYESQLVENQEKGGRAEMFDMVQSHIAGTKRKAQQTKESQNKKQKEDKFKF